MPVRWMVIDGQQGQTDRQIDRLTKPDVQIGG